MSVNPLSSEGLTGAGGSVSKVAHSHGRHSYAGWRWGSWCLSEWVPHRGAMGPAPEWPNYNAFYDQAQKSHTVTSEVSYQSHSASPKAVCKGMI